MPNRSHITCVRVFPLAIPLRKTFRHATQERRVADPIVVQVELADGTLGHGETLPRPYVSGETTETVLEAIRDPFLDELVSMHPGSFAEALERIDALPMVDEVGQIITAARAGVELALLDAYSRHFNRAISEAVGWLGLPGLGEPGSRRQVRYSGVLSGESPRKLKMSVLKMRLFGLRDYKLKVGYPDDVERITAVAEAIGGGLGKGATLRLDANGGWQLGDAVAILTATRSVPIRWVEQPLARGSEAELVSLKQKVDVQVNHDESLILPGDAERLLDAGVADAFNIRVSKNGGFLPSLRLAHIARRAGIAYQLGCMVGETSLLSAAGRRFIENVPGIGFAEGSYGRFLLAGDIADRWVGFGFGGKVRPLFGPGWGVEVRRNLMDRYLNESIGRVEMPL